MRVLSATFSSRRIVDFGELETLFRELDAIVFTEAWGIHGPDTLAVLWEQTTQQNKTANISWENTRF